jgi:multidrug efflux pump
MVLGAVPLALARGAGAESRQAIGWVIVGGLLLGTLLTLFVIPTVYSLLVRGVRLPFLVDEEATLVPGTGPAAAGAGLAAGPHQRREH